MPELPTPLADYFSAANDGDADRITACFAADAVVHDESEDIVGRPAIRAWAVATRQKYQFTTVVTGVAGSAAQPVVEAKVSGNFPGSPVELTYRFTLADGKISRLAIG